MGLHGVGGLCGDVVCFDRFTERKESVESAKVLIDTMHIPFIEEHLWLSLEESGFSIYVKELGMAMSVRRVIHD